MYTLEVLMGLETILKRLGCQCLSQSSGIGYCCVHLGTQLLKGHLRFSFSVSLPTEYLGCSHTLKTEKLSTLGSHFLIGLYMPIVRRTPSFIIFLVVSFQCFFCKPLLKDGTCRTDAPEQFSSRHRTWSLFEL